MQLSRTPYRALVILLGVISACTALSAHQAVAQSPPPVSDPVAEEFRLTEREHRILRNSQLRTASPDDIVNGPARRAWTRSLPKAAPRVLPHLGGPALAVPAGTIWGRNLVVFKTSITGDTFYIGADVDARVAEGALIVEGVNTDNTVGTRAVVLGLDWRVASGCSYRCAATSEVRLSRSVQNLYCFSYSTCYGMGGYVHPGNGETFSLSSVPVHSTAAETTTYDPSVVRRSSGFVQANQPASAAVQDYSNRAGHEGYGPRRKISDLCTTPGCSTVRDLPSFEVGAVEVRPDYQPSPGDLALSPEETKRFVDNLESDAEYDPAWETAEDHPWDRPDRDWTHMEPNPDHNDEEIFGPYDPNEWPWFDDAGQDYILYEDGTMRINDAYDTVYINGRRMIWVHRIPGMIPEYTYREGSTIVPRRYPLVCDAELTDQVFVIKYPDGLRRELVFAGDVPLSEVHTADPKCDNWFNDQGSAIPRPPDAPPVREYSLSATPTRPPGYTGEWPF